MIWTGWGGYWMSLISFRIGAQAVDLNMVDSKIRNLMPELGFAPDDGDRLVASFSSGWQMRMSLGKILFQVLFSRAKLTSERGEKTAIIGPNGSAKSSLLKIIMGLKKTIAGEVLLGEQNVLRTELF